MCQGSPVPLCTKSPDLTITDCYLWGFIKKYVFEEEPTQEAMMNKIRTALSNVLQIMKENKTDRISSILSISVLLNWK